MPWWRNHSCAPSVWTYNWVPSLEWIRLVVELSYNYYFLLTLLLCIFGRSFPDKVRISIAQLFSAGSSPKQFPCNVCMMVMAADNQRLFSIVYGATILIFLPGLQSSVRQNARTSEQPIDTDGSQSSLVWTFGVLTYSEYVHIYINSHTWKYIDSEKYEIPIDTDGSQSSFLLTLSVHTS